MIEIRGVFHSLGKEPVLKDISLTVPEQTVLGIVGINGAGKSTLLRLLAGVYLPDEGSILYDGRPPKNAATRREIFFLPDDPYYTAYMTPVSLFKFYQAFYPQMDRAVFDGLLKEYGIKPKGLVRNFSKGMRRQVFIAIALAVKPKYLLLDEAFDGLDPLSRKQFKDFIIDWIESEGGTVLISSHSLRELEDFCDRFVLIDKQTIKSHGDIAEHVGRFCKFELAFVEKIEERMFADLPVVDLSLRGKFAQIVLEGDSEEMRQRLEALSPAVLEEMALDFEEAFIHDLKKKKEGGDEK